MLSEAATGERLLVSAEELGHLLGVHRSTIWSWHSSGRLPSPVRIGGTTRWRAEEIRDWIRAGCPSRRRWHEMREDKRNADAK